MISEIKNRIQLKEEKLDKLWNQIQKCIPNNLETALALLNTYTRDGEGLIELRKCLALAEKDKEDKIKKIDEWENNCPKDKSLIYLRYFDKGDLLELKNLLFEDGDKN